MQVASEEVKFVFHPQKFEVEPARLIGQTNLATSASGEA
jgi:hypothetical protein